MVIYNKLVNNNSIWCSLNAADTIIKKEDLLLWIPI